MKSYQKNFLPFVHEFLTDQSRQPIQSYNLESASLSERCTYQDQYSAKKKVLETGTSDEIISYENKMVKPDVAPSKFHRRQKGIRYFCNS